MAARRRTAPTHRPAPVLRRNAVRVPSDVAALVRAGHPWIFRDALGGREPALAAGSVVDVHDGPGKFLGRGLYDAHGPIAVRVATRIPDETIDANYLVRKLKQAQGLRERLVDLERVTAYRLFQGDSEGFPGLAVDRYGDFVVAQFFTQSAFHFAPALYDALAEVVSPKGIYEQQRLQPLTGQKPRKPAEKVRGELAPLELEVAEDEARFLVDLSAPQNVGLFLDLREGRRQLARLSRGARVLNLFSYTGAFSVHAALGGAKEIVSVDLAAKAHARARRNFERSGMDPDVGKQYFTDDAMAALHKLATQARRFDIVICDPPSFSQNKGQIFAAQKDWADLAHASLAVLEPGGLLVACSNTSKLSGTELERALGRGAGLGQTELLVTSRIGLSPDFPVAAGFAEGHYLKCVIARRGAGTVPRKLPT